MKKEIIFGAFIIFLTGTSFFVTAQNSYYDQQVFLEAGWNLVHPQALSKYIFTAEDSPQLNKEMIEKGISSVFFYWFNNNYLQLYPYDKSKTEEMLLDYSGKYESQNNPASFFNTAVWAFSPREQTITFSAYSLPISSIKLRSGWNFLAVTPEMNRTSFSDFKGSCNIIKMCSYQRNNWDCVAGSEINPSNSMADQDGDLWKGLIIKVPENCNLGNSGVASPPSIPSEEFVPSCVFAAPFNCASYLIKTDSVVFEIRNGGGEKFNINQIMIGSPLNCVASEPTTIDADSIQKFYLRCENSHEKGTQIKADVSIKYTKIGSNTESFVTGKISGIVS